MDRHVLSAGRAMCAAAACALVVLALATPVHAQAVRGTLLGSIADTSGSSVPGATVTATDQGTSISSTTVTNQDGFYTFPNLKDGIYRVEAELTRLQEGRTRERPRRRQHDHPHRSHARSRRDHRSADGERRPAAAAVRSRRHRPHHPGRADRGDAARLRPQLPGHGGDGARRLAALQAALRVLQLAGLAVVERQRPVAPRQQRADRGRRQQPPHRPADRADSVGRGARDRQRHDQQLRRRVRPRRRRRHQRHAEVGHQPVQGQRVLFRQHRGDHRHQSVRRSHPAQGAPEGADRLPPGRLHARRPDHPQPAVLLRRLHPHQRRPRPHQPLHDPDRGDAQRRLQRVERADLRSADRRSRDRRRPHPVPGQPDSRRSHQPDRAPDPGQRARAEHRRRGARPDQLPGRDRARTAHRRLRREVQLPAVAEGSAVGPLQLPAPDRVRAGQLRRQRVRRALPGRLRRHRRQQDTERGRQLDPDADQHVRDGRALRRQHVPQRGAQRRQRPEHRRRRRHSRRQPRHLHERDDDHQPAGLFEPDGRVRQLAAVEPRRDDLHRGAGDDQAEGQPHDQVRRRLPPQQRLPAADAGPGRAARLLHLQRRPDRRAEHRRDAEQRRQCAGRVPARSAEQRRSRPRGHRASRAPSTRRCSPSSTTSGRCRRR